jgi:hypothetical protein
MSTNNWPTGDRRPTIFAPKITKLNVTFVKNVTVKQQRGLIQQGNQQSVESQQMQCEVLTDSGQTVEESSGHCDTE